MKEFLHDEQPKKHCWRLKDHLSRNRIPFEESRRGNAFTINVYSTPPKTQYLNRSTTPENDHGQLRHPF